MIFTGRGEALESILALSRVLEDPGHAVPTPEESERNIRDNIAKFAIFLGNPAPDRHRVKIGASCLLLTNNGFFLTAYHAIEEYEKEWDKAFSEGLQICTDIPKWLESTAHKYGLVSQDRLLYPLDMGFRVMNKDQDIALLKAVIPGKKPEPNRFLIYEEDLMQGDNLSLYAMEGQELIHMDGYVIYERARASFGDENPRDVHDTFITNIRGAYGFSGGTYVKDGAFAGMESYKVKTKPDPFSGGIKAAYVKELIFRSIFALRERVL